MSSVLKALRPGLLVVCGALALFAQDANPAGDSALTGWDTLSAAMEGQDETATISTLKTLPFDALDKEEALGWFRFALKRGLLQTCRVMLKSGLVLQAKDENGRSILMEAIGECWPTSAVEFLIDEVRIPVGIRTEWGESALSLALHREDFGMAQFLMGRGARPYPELWSGDLFNISNKRIRFMVDNIPLPSNADLNSWVPLTGRLADLDDPILFSRLVERGLDPQVVDVSGQTLLHVVGSPGAIRMLVGQYHLDVNARTNPDPLPTYGGTGNGMCLSHTPLSLAIQWRRHDCVATLLELGADAQAVDEGGRQPLHYAMQSTPEIVDLLLRHQASLRWMDKKGETPFQWALRDLKMTAPLLAAGEHLSDEDSSYAVRNSPPDVLVELRRTGGLDPLRRYPGIGSPLAYALKNRNQAAISALMPMGDLTNPLTDQGETALHLIVQNRFLPSTELAALISQMRCPVDAVNARGETALLLAVKKRRLDGIAALVARGSDPHLKDRSGRSPLDYALELQAKVPPHFLEDVDQTVAILQ